jgi:hypothetical protein
MSRGMAIAANMLCNTKHGFESLAFSRALRECEVRKVLRPEFWGERDIVDESSTVENAGVEDGGSGKAGEAS